MSGSNAVKANSENMNDTKILDSGGSTQGEGVTMVGLLFPEAREFDGAWWNTWENGGGTVTRLSSSIDTTNGVDGTWVDRAISSLHDGTPSFAVWRTGITSAAVSNVTGLRFYAQQSTPYRSEWRKAHAYGTFSPGTTPDRILFLDTENSDAVFSKVLDYAEVPRGQTQVRTIKLKNNSATKTINTIQLTATALYLNAASWYTFSLDDVAYQATLNTIGNLGPGDTKLIYVKQSVPDAEQLVPQTARLRVAHASLT